jgi:hypothetical protein
MSCFKPSLCTEEREREGWGDWKGRKEKGKGGERESWEGGIGGVAAWLECKGRKGKGKGGERAGREG